MSSETSINNEFEKSPDTNQHIPDTNAKSDTKEDIEERYNKLRGFAVKLKKKVSDLSEELKNSENDKQKVIAEKDELQNKILQLSDNAKVLQRLQSAYDKVQDDLEKQKIENKKISKNLETVVLENASLKETLYEEKENFVRCKNELDHRTKEITNLENALKNQQNLMKKIKEEKKAETVIKEQRESDYEAIKIKLELETESHEVTKAQLEAAKQERTTNSVLSLEVDNYERSVEDLKSKLEEESEKRNTLDKIIEENLQTISRLENEVQDLRDNCLAKSNQITILSDKNESLKAELCEMRHEIANSNKEIQALNENFQTVKQENNKLTKNSEKAASEKATLSEEMNLLRKNHTHEIKALESELTKLNNLVSSTNQELDALRNEYNGYKLRAQSVLRTKQSQNKESVANGRTYAEIEEELEHTRNHTAQLQEKLESCRESVKDLTTELNIAREEKDRSIENSKELGQKLSALGQDYTTLRDQYRLQTSMVEKQRTEFLAKTKALEKNHEKEVAQLEMKYRKEIDRLELELEKSMTNSRLGEHFQSSSILNEKHNEIKSEQDSHSRSGEILLQEREDGEGSESIDSYPIGLTNHEEMSRRQSLIPLDELLNSSDDYSKSRQVPALSRKVDRQELELCERRVKHLTVLLADTERDVAKLTQLNQLLKEDIRRQQRSAEREHIANNFEYMKNVILKFVTLKNGDERSRLIPVLNTILKLSPEETHQLNQVAGVGRGWLPGIPIPGWHNN